MSHQSLVVAALLAATAALSGCVHELLPHGDPRLQRQATLGPEQARAIALAARSGDVREWEIERVPGENGLRYSFEIESRGAFYKVAVDARDGAVLENAEDVEEAD